MTVQITLTEEAGTETMPTHGLVDVAAALASDAWNDTQAGQAVGELHLAVQDHIPPELANAVGHIMYSREEAVRYGAPGLCACQHQPRCRERLGSVAGCRQGMAGPNELFRG